MLTPVALSVMAWTVPTHSVRRSPLLRECRAAPPAMEDNGLLSAPVPRASPLALQTLRDMASISAAMREMQQAVRPLAEFGLTAQQGELLATLKGGVLSLEERLSALQSVADDALTPVGLGDDTEMLMSEPEDLKMLRAQAQKLQRETESQQQVRSGSPEYVALQISTQG